MRVASAVASVVTVCLASVLVVVAAGAKEAAQEDWNEAGIEWLTDSGDGVWTNALAQARDTGRPILLLVHRTWCGACKQLRPRFAASQELQSAAGDLVMVKTSRDGGFEEDKFKPDGGYFPRILFFDSDGELMEGVTQREDKYKYFHFEAASIVKAMREAVKINAGRGSPGREVHEAPTDKTKEEL